jgi:parallel beta-helix repeat protein
MPAPTTPPPPASTAPPAATTPPPAATPPPAPTPSAPPEPALPAGTRVTSFGARGDGSTDDTAAIVRARDAAGSGGTVVFPAGTYLISGVSVNVAGQRWVLDAQATLRLRPGAGSDLLRMSAADAVVTGGRLDGNRAAQTTSGTCLTVSAPRATIEAMDIGECRGWGIYVRGAANVRILRNVVHDTGDASIFIESDSVRGSDNAVVDGNTVRRTTREGAGGIIVHGTGTVATVAPRIANNRVENVAQISIEVWGSVPRSVIVGNTTVGGYMGISVDRSHDAQVLGNRVFAARLYGIELAASHRCVVRDNTVDESGVAGSTGIALTGVLERSRNNLIEANTVISARRGIQLNKDSHDNTIARNVIRGWTTFGIELIGSERIRIESNTISAGGNQAIALDNSRNVEILTNSVRTASVAVGTYGHDGVTVDFVTIARNTFESVGTVLTKAGSVGTNIFYDGL